MGLVEAARYAQVCIQSIGHVKTQKNMDKTTKPQNTNKFMYWKIPRVLQPNSLISCVSSAA